jgi:hypothetical protein
MQQQVEDHSLGSKLFAKKSLGAGSSCFELFKVTQMLFKTWTFQIFAIENMH